MAEIRTRLKVAYVGRDLASVPTVRVDLEFTQNGVKLYSSTQRTFRRNDIDEAQAKANQLLKDGHVQEVREM